MIEGESVTVVSYIVAFGGGLISFASPCVLPVVPGYLSLITGLDIGELEESKRSNSLAVIRDTSQGANGNGLYRSLGGTGGMPLTAFYDANGNLVQVDRGELSTQVLASRLQQLFGLTV